MKPLFWHWFHCQGRKSSWTELNELNWKNWMEALGRHASNWTDRTVSRPDQADELNWTNFFESILNWICVTLTLHHIPDKWASTAVKAHHPSTQATYPEPAGWDFCRRGPRTVPLLLPNNWRLDGLNRAWTELNWTEALGPHAPNWTERTFRTNWWRGNWTVLNWCQTILNFERDDLVSSQTLPALISMSRVFPIKSHSFT